LIAPLMPPPNRLGRCTDVTTSTRAIVMRLLLGLVP
jgi:hypothetical protein